MDAEESCGHAPDGSHFGPGDQLTAVSIDLVDTKRRKGQLTKRSTYQKVNLPKGQLTKRSTYQKVSFIEVNLPKSELKHRMTNRLWLMFLASWIFRKFIISPCISEDTMVSPSIKLNPFCSRSFNLTTVTCRTHYRCQCHQTVSPSKTLGQNRLDYFIPAKYCQHSANINK
jgi:hypothetical protein